MTYLPNAIKKTNNLAFISLKFLFLFFTIPNVLITSSETKLGTIIFIKD